MKTKSQQKIFFLCLLSTLLSACAGTQSALNPAGPQAARISGLWWLLFWGCAAVFVFTMLALVLALRRGRERATADDSPPTERRIAKVVGGAVAVSVVILFVFLLADLWTGRALTVPPSRAWVISVIGHQWWWDFEYEDTIPSQQVRISDEIHIPVGQPVKFELTSQDVIHSFWVPNLHGKTDLLTGHQTITWIAADRAGTYRGQCAEYCGHQHAHMAFTVVAEPPEQFTAWLDNQRRPAPAPTTAEQRAGQQIFLTRTCVMCHQIRGTEAGGRTAPDLTHVATRQFIAAGTLPNTRDNLRRWITDPQGIKPGTRMPANPMSNEDMEILLSYLESLQ